MTQANPELEARVKALEIETASLKEQIRTLVIELGKEEVSAEELYLEDRQAWISRARKSRGWH